MNNVDAQGRWIEVHRLTERTVSVTCLQAGQAKPYGDSWYRYRVRVMVGREGEAKVPDRVTDHRLVEMAQPMIGERLYWPGSAPHAFAPVITTCEEQEPGLWLLEARALYND